MKILVGTQNPGKQVEMVAILAELGLDLVLPQDIGLALDVVENGQTYAQNAELKARAFCAASGLPCLADDSGLEVDALDGAPGLYSARYSPAPGASDADRRRLLVSRLAGLPHPWTARFRATVCLMTPGGEPRFAEGQCEGEIIPEERGSNGFGYDAIFLVAGTGLTMAELSDAEKNRISHRARALHGITAIFPRA